MAVKKAPEFEIDLNNWKYAEFQEYLKLLKEDNLAEAAVYAAKVILSWPFEQEITSENLMDLGVKDLLATFRAIGLSLKNSFSEGE